MNNSKNKIRAAVVCGIIIGSVGTSVIGNFQTSSANDNNGGKQVPNGGDRPQMTNGTEQGDFEGGKGQSGSSGKSGKGGHHQGEGSLEAESTIDVANGQYKDGTYTGSAPAYGSDLKVEVSISGGKISNIDIVSHNETPGFYERAFESVPKQILAKQSTDVDTVSGATYSSVGIINAVNSALESASK